MSKRRTCKKKAPRVAYRFIRPDSEIGARLYALLQELVTLHHDEILGARIALAWNLSWSPDVDGRVTLGKCRKVSDLDREVADVLAYDFVIVLRQEFWDDPLVTAVQRRALLDHELCHCSVKVDEHGDAVVDERGRTVYRLRRHDLEEFSEIADRYGCWKADIEAFARALDHAHQKTDGQWVGYQSLQEDLRLAGVSLPLEVLREWSADERREARTWAVLRQQFPTATGIQRPLCLVNAIMTGGARDSSAASVAGDEGAQAASVLEPMSAPASELAAADPSASEAREP
jgi:hypothetical protein